MLEPVAGSAGAKVMFESQGGLPSRTETEPVELLPSASLAPPSRAPLFDARGSQALLKFIRSRGADHRRAWFSQHIFPTLRPNLIIIVSSRTNEISPINLVA